MLTRIPVVLLCLLAVAFSAPSSAPVRVIRVDVPSHDAVYALARELGLDVTDAQDDHVIAYADDAMIARVRARGLPVTVLVADHTREGELDPGTYFTYTEACSALAALAATYPAIARLDTVGWSYENHAIPALLVTDNPAADEAEPVVRLVGAHHGREKTSTEIVLAFANYLCGEYGSNGLVTDLVDSREFWLIPIFNPDGHIANSRYNGAGVDLNRDYGYEWELYSAPFTQPETRALRDFSEMHPPTVEYEYHTEASYVNYLWDNHPADPPDSMWVKQLAARYADSTYGSSTTRLDSINGFRWYEVHGSCQDYAFGIYGCLAYTIETQRPSSNRAQVDSICVANRRALLDMAQLAGRGVSGTVLDSATGAPLAARVEFTSPRRWHATTALPVGDFHRMVAPGTYNLRASANGYLPRDIAGVVVPDTGVTLEIRLAPAPPDSPCHALCAVTLKRVDDSHTWSDWYLEALGPPDGSSYTLGSGTSEVVLELSPPALDNPGDDITVHAAGSYSVAASDSWLGPWHSLGAGSGTQGFDLAAPGLDSARYLQVRNSSGAVLDAVSYRGAQTGTQDPGIALPGRHRLAVAPSPTAGPALVSFSAPAPGRPRLWITDVAGRTVRALSPATATGSMTWDLRDDAGREVGNGVYFVNLEHAGRVATAKLAVRR